MSQSFFLFEIGVKSTIKDFEDDENIVNSPDLISYAVTILF